MNLSHPQIEVMWLHVNAGGQFSFVASCTRAYTLTALQTRHSLLFTTSHCPFCIARTSQWLYVYHCYTHPSPGCGPARCPRGREVSIRPTAWLVRAGTAGSRSSGCASRGGTRTGARLPADRGSRRGRGDPRGRATRPDPAAPSCLCRPGSRHYPADPVIRCRRASLARLSDLQHRTGTQC